MLRPKPDRFQASFRLNWCFFFPPVEHICKPKLSQKEEMVDATATSSIILSLGIVYIISQETLMCQSSSGSSSWLAAQRWGWTTVTDHFWASIFYFPASLTELLQLRLTSTSAGQQLQQNCTSIELEVEILKHSEG